MTVLNPCLPFSSLFSWSLFDSGTVPTLRKTSLIVPIPRKPKPTELNHYRPVAPTPLAMKYIKRIILKNLLPFVQPHLDPPHFAYQSERGVEDAIATLLHRLLKQPETPGHHARILSVDYHQWLRICNNLRFQHKAYAGSVFGFLSVRPVCEDCWHSFANSNHKHCMELLKGVSWVPFCTSPTPMAADATALTAAHASGLRTTQPYLGSCLMTTPC